MNNWLVAGTQIDAVCANNDEMAIGAIIALQQAGKDPKKIFVGGVDATRDALAEMEKGNLAVTVFQDAKGQGKGCGGVSPKAPKEGEVRVSQRLRPVPAGYSGKLQGVPRKNMMFTALRLTVAQSLSDT